MKVYYPGLADNCRRLLEKVLPDLRETAREHGYALAIHGSVARDIDMVAIPWTEQAWDAADLVAALLVRAERANGYAYFAARQSEPVEKPHGRLSWVIHLGSGVYIDLSVMPKKGIK